MDKAQKHGSFSAIHHRQNPSELTSYNVDKRVDETITVAEDSARKHHNSNCTSRYENTKSLVKCIHQCTVTLAVRCNTAPDTVT
jgi:hypothetical protein